MELQSKKNGSLPKYLDAKSLSKSLEDIHGIKITPERIREWADASYLPSYEVGGVGPYFRPQEAKDFIRENLVERKAARPFPSTLQVIDSDVGMNRPESVPKSIAPMLDHLYELPMSHVHRAGVVYFLVKGGEIIYVGQSVSLAGRVLSHVLEKEFDRVLYIFVPKSQLDQIEAQYISASTESEWAQERETSGVSFDRLTAPTWIPRRIPSYTALLTPATSPSKPHHLVAIWARWITLVPPRARNAGSRP